MSENPPAEQTTEVRLRRAPRLPVFLLAGAILGVIVTLIITVTVGQVDQKVGFAATFGYFCVFGVPAGIVLGAVVGLLLDRRSQRLARVVEAERAQVEAPAEPDVPAPAPAAPNVASAE